MTKLRDIASAVRSANAGASLRTFDIMFDRPEDFRRVVEAEAVSPSVVACLYAVPVDEAQGLHLRARLRHQSHHPPQRHGRQPRRHRHRRQTTTRPPPRNRHPLTPLSGKPSP